MSSQQVNNNRNTRRRRRSRRSNPQTSLVRQPNLPVPVQLTINQRYSDVLVITNTTGVYNYYVYRMNSTFDPDFSGAGHQPLGRDQLAALYTDYRVNEFIWDLTATCAAAAQSVVAAHPTNASGNPGSTQLQSETAWGKQSMTAFEATPVKFRGRLPLHQFRGQSRQTYLGDNNNSSDCGSNPANGAYFILGSQSTTATTNTTHWTVDLTYNVTYFSPIALGQS